jgi:hypothetical protein
MTREKASTPAPRKRAPRKTLIARPAEPVMTRFVDPEQRACMIAEAAYYRAERRAFAPGHETEDWLAAEAEVDQKLLREAAAPGV